jgi:hypothetical protein
MKTMDQWTRVDPDYHPVTVEESESRLERELAEIDARCEAEAA